MGLWSYEQYAEEWRMNDISIVVAIFFLDSSAVVVVVVDYPAYRQLNHTIL
jgi:hypothetical protein